jgi:hypothetical protein
MSVAIFVIISKESPTFNALNSFSGMSFIFIHMQQNLLEGRSLIGCKNNIDILLIYNIFSRYILQNNKK